MPPSVHRDLKIVLIVALCGQQAAEKKARELEEKEDTRKYVELAMAQEEAKVASQGNVEYLRRLKTVENARVNIDLSASYASAKRERVMEEVCLAWPVP